MRLCLQDIYLNIYINDNLMRQIKVQIEHGPKQDFLTGIYTHHRRDTSDM